MHHSSICRKTRVRRTRSSSSLCSILLNPGSRATTRKSFASLLGQPHRTHGPLEHAALSCDSSTSHKCPNMSLYRSVHIPTDITSSSHLFKIRLLLHSLRHYNHDNSSIYLPIYMSLYLYLYLYISLSLTQPPFRYTVNVIGTSRGQGFKREWFVDRIRALKVHSLSNSQTHP